MPHCVAYGCIPKVRTAAEGNGKKISYYKIPQKNQLRKAWESRTRCSDLVLSKFLDYALHQGPRYDFENRGAIFERLLGLLSP